MDASSPLPMVVAFGTQTRVRCPSCKKYIQSSDTPTCPRCFISYRKVDERHYVVEGAR